MREEKEIKEDKTPSKSIKHKTPTIYPHYAKKKFPCHNELLTYSNPLIQTHPQHPMKTLSMNKSVALLARLSLSSNDPIMLNRKCNTVIEQKYSVRFEKLCREDKERRYDAVADIINKQQCSTSSEQFCNTINEKECNTVTNTVNDGNTLLSLRKYESQEKRKNV